MKNDSYPSKTIDSNKSVGKMSNTIDKAIAVIEARKFPQDQVGLEGFVLVPTIHMFDLYMALYDVGYLAEPWKHNDRKTSIELVGR